MNVALVKILFFSGFPVCEVLVSQPCTRLGIPCNFMLFKSDPSNHETENVRMYLC